MSFSFVIPELNIGGAGTPPLQFFKQSFVLGGTGGSTPTWQDITIHGVGALSLVNAKANSLEYLKLFGMCEQSALPQGYTQLDSIHLDGNCYFDTGIVIKSLNSVVKLIASFVTSISYASPRMMWGYMGSSNSLPRWGVGGYSSQWLATPNATNLQGTIDGDRHTFITSIYDVSGTAYYKTLLDGESLVNTQLISPETFTVNTLNTYIGARNNNGTASNYIKGNFTYFELQQDGVVEAKIYPCKRNWDNALGLYNTVTNEFLTKQGTGTLTAGSTTLSPSPDMALPLSCNNGTIKARMTSGLPLGYYRVEYITSTKSIDLGIKTTQNTVLESRFYKASTDAQYLYYSDSQSSGTSNTTAYLASVSGNWRFGNRTLSISVSANVWHTSKQNKDGVYIDGANVDSYSTVNDFRSSNNLAAFGAASNAPVRVDYIKERDYNSTTYNHRWVACKRYDGVYGLYDMEGNTFRTNSEATITGGTVTDTIETYVYGTTETVQVHSTNVFNKNATDALMQGFPAADGKWNDSTNFRSTCCILSENKTYTITRVTTNPSSAAMRVIAYDKVPTNAYYGTPLFIGQNTDKTATITVPVGKPYIVTYVKHSGDSITDQTLLDGFHVELGDTALDYQDYWVGDSATATNLLGVLNKSGQNIYAQDVQNVTTGAVTRNVGVKVFDGTETWTKASNYDADGHNVFYIALTDRKVNDTNIGMVCSHYKFKGTVSYSTLKTGEMAILQSASSTYFDGGSATTVTAWTNFVKEQFANGTPITLVYPLATATTESVTAQSLDIQAGTNVIEITQASIDGLELEVKYKAGVEVTIEEIEDAQLSNDVTVTVS